MLCVDQPSRLINKLMFLLFQQKAKKRAVPKKTTPTIGRKFFPSLTSLRLLQSEVDTRLTPTVVRNRRSHTRRRPISPTSSCSSSEAGPVDDETDCYTSPPCLAASGVIVISSSTPTSPTSSTADGPRSRCASILRTADSKRPVVHRNKTVTFCELKTLM